MINKILTKYDKKGELFFKWYISKFNSNLNVNAFLKLDDTFKIFVVLVYLEECFGINITGDNFNILISYSMRYINNKVIKHVENNNSNVIYASDINTIPKVFPNLITNYQIAIEYVFDNII